MNNRVRYAPSPTGLQHIGGLRTAFFNYLFARSQNGKFILRLEDTDQSRFDENYVKNIYDSFSWLGIYWDEGPDKAGPFVPYIQSKRNELYKKYAHELLKNGHAYYCFCSRGDEDRGDNSQSTIHNSQLEDDPCRGLLYDESKRRADSGESFVVRMKAPREGSTTVVDMVF